MAWMTMAEVDMTKSSSLKEADGGIVPL